MAILSLAHTTSGDLNGVQSAGVIQFRGVPYAEPPIGERRFAPPRPFAAWTGLRDASQHGPVPPQPPSRLRQVVGDMAHPQSEDCLTLTITTPAPDTKARPVLVWLHGGGYLSGAGSLEWYDGTLLAREGDQVVVGVNYRLGPLGFLYQPGISNGKLGLLDVIAALQWVQEHIDSFGGDSHQVTVAGQSAGAHMLLCLLAMPDTRHLFQRAILQSAPAGLTPLSEEIALDYGKRFLAHLQAERGQDAETTALLKAVAPAYLLEAMGKLAREATGFAQVAPPFLPMIEELSTPEHFLAAAAAGAGAAGIDLIIGTNREEANTFLADSAMQEPDPAQVADLFTTLAGHQDAYAAYRLRRPGGTVVELVSDLVTDFIFRFPSLQFAEAASRAGAHTWVYQFNWAPSQSSLRACHCLELPCVFGNREAWHSAPMLHAMDPAVFADLSGAMRSAWTSFVHTGDPSTGIPWPQYQAHGRQTMQWDELLGPVGDPAGVSWRESSARSPL